MAMAIPNNYNFDCAYALDKLKSLLAMPLGTSIPVYSFCSLRADTQSER